MDYQTFPGSFAHQRLTGVAASRGGGGVPVWPQDVVPRAEPAALNRLPRQLRAVLRRAFRRCAGTASVASRFIRVLGSDPTCFPGLVRRCSMGALVAGKKSDWACGPGVLSLPLPPRPPRGIAVACGTVFAEG